jgi:eukaryotic-like serine/threonine-protein kinase
MALEGSERKILHAILHEQGEALAGYVDDTKIAEIAHLSIDEVRDCLETLDAKVCVQRSIGVHGYSAYITAKGRQELRRSPVISVEEKAESPLKIVPKGLRSFDAEDKDFFLELLPGPRRGDGLPESVHFWKVRIEEMDPDKTFRVGYIFGPSGCGKSSLVKAGLLPRLSKPIISIYIEATGEDTEARLLRGLRKHDPDLPLELDLRSALVAKREKIREGSNKILLVIDQFEQWYQAKGAEPVTELAKALSECDGGRVQAIILVRDDYSMALYRFMAVIGVKQNQDQNFAVVDLFDLQHARRVLIAFGRGYGMLPDDPKKMTGAQNEFLDRTIKGLSQEGRVVSVRLALLAEMLKGKTWTPETLKQVGGAEGVGVTFLEETFSAKLAPPSYRIHQKAAQAVLRALLPETGSNIKGNMRSYHELLEVSGYRSRPNEFDELLRILNSELRLISPIEPDSSDSEGQTRTQEGERYFLLTHDYLVPSIREWLTRKQKETGRGRAELRLVERSASWNAKPENRHLPSALEWANILLLTKKKGWTDPQRRMMKRAGRVHGVRGVLTFALLSAGVLAGIAVRRQVIENQRATHAADLVQRVLDADTAQVPEIVKAMADHRQWVDSSLRSELTKSSYNSRQKLHASLALLPVDVSQVDYLFNRLLRASPSELPVLRDVLKPHSSTLTPKLWTTLESAKPGDANLLPAASALASYSPEDGRWEEKSGTVAQALVNVNPFFFVPWLDALRPVRTKLNAPLANIFREKSRPESERALATSILTDYASDDTTLIANLLMDADPKAYAAIFPIAQRHQATTLPLFQAEIARKATIPEGEKDTEIVKDRLAQRQARAAVALLRMGETEEVIPLLRHSADPRLRSFIVNWLNPLGTDPQIIAAALKHIDPGINPTPEKPPKTMDAILFHPETSQRRALILALGTYGTEGLSPGEQKLLNGKLLDLYRDDPDAGVHGAVEWALRQWKNEEKLKDIDAELSILKDWGERRWFMNSLGQTFAVIDGPVEFMMGSPPTEPDRDSDEIPHRVVVPRRFAIATKEISVELYQRFTKDRSTAQKHHLKKDRYSPDPKGPMNGPSWYDAAAFCNWLSEQEGLSKDQWCYLPVNGKYTTRMTIPANILERKGYRLPTEAEWEYSCRSGSVTSRYYGPSLDLLDRYARYQVNSKEHAWTCGSLRPNELGLFDMLGNVYEWVQDEHQSYKADTAQAVPDNINII